MFVSIKCADAITTFILKSIFCCLLPNRFIGFFLAILMVTTCALADESTFKVFGFTIAIVQSSQGKSLQVDGKAVHANYIIGFDEIAIVDGQGVVTGYSGSGGNACDVSPFVLSFPNGKLPRLDGPLETCDVVSTKINSDSIDFSTKPMAGRNGDQWKWTPSDGFHHVAIIKFSPTEQKGWSELRSRMIEHPSELFEFKALAVQLDKLLGSNKSEFTSLVTGPGSIDFKGDVLVAKSCQAHNCSRAGTIILADIRAKLIYLAWKEDSGLVIVRPEVKTWPSAFRSELKNWVASYK